MAKEAAKTKATAKPSERTGGADRWHLVQQGNRFMKVQSAEPPPLDVEDGERTKVLIMSGSREAVDAAAERQKRAYGNAIIED